MRPRSRLSRLALPTALALLAGCDEGTPQPKTREILNKRTTEIRDAKQETKAGAVETKPHVAASNPLTQAGSVYVYSISKTSQLQIQQALDLYRANNDGQYPKDTKQFMEEVVKPNNIALPTLPYYQEYAYNADEHKLVVMEYPDRKAAANHPK